MFVIRNRASGMKMDEKTTLAAAMERATELAEEHQQVYEICELTVRSTIYPTPSADNSDVGMGIGIKTE